MLFSSEAMRPPPLPCAPLRSSCSLHLHPILLSLQRRVEVSRFEPPALPQPEWRKAMDELSSVSCEVNYVTYVTDIRFEKIARTLRGVNVAAVPCVLGLEVRTAYGCDRHVVSMEQWQPAKQRQQHDTVELCTATEKSDSCACKMVYYCTITSGCLFYGHGNTRKKEQRGW